MITSRSISSFAVVSLLLCALTLFESGAAVPCSSGPCCDTFTYQIKPFGADCGFLEEQKRSIERHNSSSARSSALANGLCVENPPKCNGVTANCPVTLLPPGTECEPAVGSCDRPSFCTGDSPDCPPKEFKPAGTICGESNLPCKNDDVCDGFSAACTEGTYKSTSTRCAVALGPCENDAFCTGSSSSCPSKQYRAEGTVCSPSTGPCQSDGTCSGASHTCAPRLFYPISFKCATATAPCENDAFCTGTSALCPTKPLKPSSHICSSSSSACEGDAYCTGTSTSCPSKPLKPSSQICSSSSTACEDNAYCTGTSSICPSKPLKPSSHICSSSSSACEDNAYCTGTSSICPSKPFRPNGTVCALSQGPCQFNSTCNGNSATCNVGAYLPVGTSCKIEGSCDANPTCSGNSASCQLSGSLKPEGGVCGLNTLCSRPVNNTCTALGECTVAQCSTCPNGNYGADCSCPLPPRPSSGQTGNSTCSNGVWSIPTVNTTTLAVYSNGSSTLIINGNLTLGNSTNSNTSTVLVFNGLATLNVTGCVTLYGKIKVILNTEDKTRINATLIHGTPCENAVNFDDVEITAQDSKKSCKQISAESSSVARGLGVLMNINSDKCKESKNSVVIKAAAGAVGAAAGICIIAAAIWTINRHSLLSRSSSVRTTQK